MAQTKTKNKDQEVDTRKLCQDCLREAYIELKANHDKTHKEFAQLLGFTASPTATIDRISGSKACTKQTGVLAELLRVISDIGAPIPEDFEEVLTGKWADRMDDWVRVTESKYAV